MHEAVILRRDAGHAIPAAILTPLLARYNSYVGIAMADGEAVKVTRLTKSDKWAPKIEDIQGFDVKFKDRGVMYVFGNITDDLINNSEIQPYTVLMNDKNDPQLVAFLDGNFSEFEKPGSVHYGQSLVIEKEISPKIEKLFKGVDKDVSKLMEEELTDPDLGKKFVNTMLGDRGAIVFLSADDNEISYIVEGDVTNKKYDWGWLSNIDRIEEIPEKVEAKNPLEAAAETFTKGSVLKRPGAPATNNTPKPASMPKPAAAPASVPEVKPSETKVAMVHVTVPNNLLKDPKKRSNFTRKRISGGVLPNNWMEMTTWSLPYDQCTPTILADIKSNNPCIRIDDPHSKIKDFKELGDKLKTETAVPAPKSPNPAPTKEHTNTAPAKQSAGLKRPGAPKTHPEGGSPVTKDVETKHIGKDKPVVTSSVTGMIPPSQRDEMIAYMSGNEFKDAVDKHSQLIGDPAGYREFDIPGFATQLKHPNIKELIDTVNWPKDVILQMMRNVPDLGMVFACAWRADAIKMREENLALKAKVAELEGVQYEAEQQAAPVKQPAQSQGLRRPAKVA
jgi:hypothetical protein